MSNANSKPHKMKAYIFQNTAGEIIAVAIVSQTVHIDNEDIERLAYEHHITVNVVLQKSLYLGRICQTSGEFSSWIQTLLKENET